MTQHLPFLDEDSSALFELLMALDERGMLWLDRNGNILYANDAFADRLGYTINFLKNHQIFDLETGLNLLDYKKRWNKLDATKQLQLDLALNDSSGDSVSLHFTGYMLSSAKGAVSCWQVQPETPDQYGFAAAHSFVNRKNAAAWQWDIVSGHFQTEAAFDELIKTAKDREHPPHQNILSALKGAMEQTDFQELLKRVKQLQQTRESFILSFTLQDDNSATSDPFLLQLYAEPVIERGIVSKIRVC